MYSIFLNFNTICINNLFYSVYTVLNKAILFLPSSPKGKVVFVCFFNFFLAFLTVVDFLELFCWFLSAFGLQDVCFCSRLELLTSISATTKQNEHYKSETRKSSSVTSEQIQCKSIRLTKIVYPLFCFKCFNCKIYFDKH